MVWLSAALLGKELSWFDHLTGYWIISFRSPVLTAFMQAITNMGSSGWVIGLMVILTVTGLYLRKHHIVLALNIAVFGAFCLTEILKRTFQRPRPPLPWFTIASGYSFPSGHALISLTFYGFLAYLVFKNSRQHYAKYVLGTFLLLIPVLVGISRIYLGVHYPSDVLGGWTIAAVWTGTCITAMEFVERNFLHHF